MATHRRSTIDDLAADGSELHEEHLRLVSGGRMARPTYGRGGKYIGEDGCTDMTGVSGVPALGGHMAF
jgi:hypothetical protein